MFFREETILNGTAFGLVKSTVLDQLILGEQYHVTMEHKDTQISPANSTLTFHACKLYNNISF